ncbi:MAG: hypothetical protein H6675_06510 [Dehalococcoidia bacterium]|nr:hypothetical protein [Dehalococcoidia bacterium]
MVAALASVGVANAATRDLGKLREFLLGAHALQEFGVIHGVDASSQESISAEAAEADPTALVTLAKGLTAKVVTASADAGANIDMMALWPNDTNPTYIIACNEQSPTEAGLQRINIATGAVATIVTGTSSCDPAHVTPWGTVIFAEEAGSSGGFYELINPLTTTGVSLNRETHTFSGGTGASNFAYRDAVGNLSFEGVAIFDNGVTYYGDENRPGSGTPGGAYFKFVPTNLWTGGAAITSLSQSPYASGTVYGLRLGRRSGNTDWGQGSNTGEGIWVDMTSHLPDLRAGAAAEKLTGYYRPEDLQVDLAAEAAGNVRVCGNNTGNEDFANWGEAICLTDGSIAAAAANSATPTVQLFVVGTSQLAMMDNMAYQSGLNVWYLQEDGEQKQGNNDIWACLEDGADEDQLSDGCIRVVTLNDLNAESTGGVFDSTGKRYFVSIQHNVTGHGVVLEITGWH